MFEVSTEALFIRANGHRNLTAALKLGPVQGVVQRNSIGEEKCPVLKRFAIASRMPGRLMQIEYIGRVAARFSMLRALSGDAEIAAECRPASSDKLDFRGRR
jgi:hypothetical protein